MPPTLFLEAFGQLSGPATIDSQEEDLHSVFRERAELMRWATTSNDSPLLWSIGSGDSRRYRPIPYRMGTGRIGSWPPQGTRATVEPAPGLVGVANTPDKHRPGHGVAGIGSMLQRLAFPLWSRRVVRSPGDGKWHGDRYRGLPWILGGCAQLV